MTPTLLDKLWFFEIVIPYLTIREIASFENVSKSTFEILKIVYKSRRHELLDSIRTLGDSVNDECLQWIALREFHCTQLDLSRLRSFTDAGFETLLAYVAPRLKKLKLTNYNLNDVTEMLSSDLFELEELVLHEVYIEESYYFTNYHKLHTVILDAESIDSSDFVGFPTSLKHLNYRNTKVYFTGINDLSKLEYLDISSCYIGNDGEYDLSDFKRLTSLTTLCINLYLVEEEDEDYITNLLWIPISVKHLTIVCANMIDIADVNHLTELESLQVWIGGGNELLEFRRESGGGLSAVVAARERVPAHY